MKELIYVTDRVIRTSGIHVYGVGITSSTHRLAAFLPLTCTSQYPPGNSRKRRPGSDTRVGREPYIPSNRALIPLERSSRDRPGK
ncbi:UNVERIFIED_CONTAM: hypothetical protein Slati_2465400 [Sesamum latifolium]|uniref:Uncharacterized protein n=1 Tax=Sesamum latifolium TaxID=2727402 RepID=A0AAW2WDL2_9LAMI